MACFWLTIVIASLDFVFTHRAVLITLFLLGLAVSGLMIWRRVRDRARQRTLAAERQAALARQRELYAIRARSIATYHAMSPREFEEALAFLCERDGCRNVQVVGKAGDLGADILATTPDGHRLVIQAKRYHSANPVSSPDVQRFGGTCFAVHGATLATLVTTSTFTRPARECPDMLRIVAFDNNALGGWASQTGPAPWHLAGPTWNPTSIGV